MVNVQNEGNQLRGIVFERFSNISSFAKAMNWDRKKASRIINMQQKPSAADMEQMAMCLGVKDVYSFVHIFLPSLSTMYPFEQIPDPLA